MHEKKHDKEDNRQQTLHSSGITSQKQCIKNNNITKHVSTSFQKTSTI